MPAHIENIDRLVREALAKLSIGDMEDIIKKANLRTVPFGNSSTELAECMCIIQAMQNEIDRRQFR